MAAKKRDSREVETLNYAVSFERGNSVFALSPAADIVAATYAKSPTLLRRVYEKEQELQSRLTPADRYARWEGEWIKENDIFGALREAVKGKEGTYILVDATVSRIFNGISLLGDRARACVASKRSESGSRGYTANFRSVFLRENGRPNVLEEHCSCPYFGEKTLSGSADQRYYNECVHISLLRHEMDKRLNHPEWRRDRLEKSGRQPKRAVFQPFAFSRNWGIINNTVVAAYPQLASLETAAVLRHFLGGETYAEINKQLLRRPEVYTPPMLGEMRRNRLRWRVIRKDTADVEISGNLAAELEFLEEAAANELGRLGFRHRGYSLLMGRNAARYERGDDAVEIVFSRDMPPFYAVKAVPKAEPDLSVLDSEKLNPFSSGAGWLERPDDFTKTKHAKAKIGILPRLGMPGSSRALTDMSGELRSWYRRDVPEAYRGEFGLA